MAASDDRETQAVQSPADEKWVFLQDGGDAAKELLLEEQDGDAKGGKEFLRWCHWAWNEVPVRKNIRHDMRPYILGVAISVNTASVVKKVELNVLFGLLGTNAVILVAGCFAGIYGVVTGLADSSKAQRGAWYLLLPVVVLRLPAFIGAMGSFPILVVLMKTDVMATFHTFRLHWRETEEARTAFLKRWLHPLKPVMLTALVIVVCFIVIIGTIVILVVFGGLSGKRRRRSPLAPYRRSQEADKGSSPQGRQRAQVMAASDARKTEAVQPGTDGKWVFLHSSGDAAKEQLLQEQDGDAIGE
ncbi:hypothetical protein MTO96_034568 [Rhipicephalus appendiculatus]